MEIFNSLFFPSGAQNGNVFAGGEAIVNYTARWIRVCVGGEFVNERVAKDACVAWDPTKSDLSA